MSGLDKAINDEHSRREPVGERPKHVIGGFGLSCPNREKGQPRLDVTTSECCVTGIRRCHQMILTPISCN